MLLILLFVLAFMGASNAQENTFSPCSSPMDWDQVVVSKAPLPDGADKFLVVTNRPYTPDDPKGRVFPNEVSEFRKVGYFVAACDGEKWMLYPVDDFLSGMEAVDNGRDILLFVHGHGKEFPSVLTRGHQIADKYDLSMIIFDWPSYNSNFNKSLSRVRRCGENYYNLLLQLQKYRSAKLGENQGISMLLHSLGNYFLTHLVVNGNNQYLDGKIFDNIILNSAAVRSKEHGDILSQIAIQDNMYVIFNNNDKVLRGAHLLTAGKMLGNEPLEPLGIGCRYIDFTPIVGTEHTYFAGYHPFEFEIPAFDLVFDTAFHGRQINLSDPEVFTRKESQAIWTVIPPKQ